LPETYSKRRIKSTITAGSVYYYREDSFNSPDPHYFIVINIDTLSDMVIFLVCASSQIDSRRRLRKDYPNKTLVEITPSQYTEFSKRSIIDCNVVFEESVDEIASKLSQRKLEIKPVMGLRLVKMLRQGAILSPLVENYIKKAASVPNVVEKGIGISYPIGKPNKNKGGYTDGERIP